MLLTLSSSSPSAVILAPTCLRLTAVRCVWWARELTWGSLRGRETFRAGLARRAGFPLGGGPRAQDAERGSEGKQRDGQGRE